MVVAGVVTVAGPGGGAGMVFAGAGSLAGGSVVVSTGVFVGTDAVGRAGVAGVASTAEEPTGSFVGSVVVVAAGGTALSAVGAGSGFAVLAVGASVLLVSSTAALVGTVAGLVSSIAVSVDAAVFPSVALALLVGSLDSSDAGALLLMAAVVGTSTCGLAIIRPVTAMAATV